MSSYNGYLETDRSFKGPTDSNHFLLRKYDDRRKKSVQF